MNVVDIAHGFLAGIVSCITFGSLLLIPLALGSAAASSRSAMIAPAAGLGLSLLLAGLGAGGLGTWLGLEAIWFRRLVCAVLILLGIALLSPAMVERHPKLTGGPGGFLRSSGGPGPGHVLRLVLLAVFVGANWYPPQGPTLLRASVMAADIAYSAPALGVLFAFGVGAAVPWIVLGRAMRLLARPFAADVVDGMAGKRLLGLVLLAVAIVGISDRDAAVVQRLDALLPARVQKISVMF